MTLADLLDHARADELSESQATEIEKVDNINTMTKRNKTSSKPWQRSGNQFQRTGSQSGRQQQKGPENSKCYRCGGSYPHKDKCPATNKTCHKCNKTGHFAKCCRSKNRSLKVREIDKKACNMNENSSREASADEGGKDYIFSVGKSAKKTPTAKVKIGSSHINMMVDSGSTVNIMSYKTYQSIQPVPTLKSAKGEKLLPYATKKEIPIVGKFQCILESKHCFTTGTVYVTKIDAGSILGFESAVELKVLHIANRIQQTHQSPGAQKICSRHPKLFQGIGKLKGTKVKLHINESVTPVAQPHRRIPFHMRKKVEAELQRLQELDIIEDVKGPTPWVSPIVAAPKPGNPEQIRICVDMRCANKAVMRTRHITPTLEELLSDLNGATMFSKLDLNKGYHQCELDESSRYITTFSTHLGLKRYKRLSFGISSAAELFQNAIEQSLIGLQGVKNMSDDILVWGKNAEEHDKNLESVFQRLQEKNLTLNKAKCQFHLDKINFFGHILSSKGVECDPQKTQAVLEASPPQNVEEVRSFLGVVGFCSRFIPNYAAVNEPLRRLTKKEIKWQWGALEENAFHTLKRSLASAKVMNYYDFNKYTEVIVDGSPFGLGAMLVQKDKPNDVSKVVAYASRSLSDVEQRYSQIERETLAMVWAVERFHLYLFGRPFTLITDHKPLESIFNKPKSKPPARIERWLMRLQSYTYNVKYRPGKHNPADYMSRHPVKQGISTTSSVVAEQYISYIVSNAVPKALTLKEILEHTKQDGDLQAVINAIETGNFDKLQKILPSYYGIKEELALGQGVVLRHSKIVIPRLYKAELYNWHMKDTRA